MGSVAAVPMPQGERIGVFVEKPQVQIPAGGTSAPKLTNEAAATIAVRDYERSRVWMEQNSWYMEWEWSDLLHQSPTLNYSQGEGNEGSARVSDFTVSNAVETMGGEVRRQIFSQQIPFLLRPRGKTSEKMVEAWTALIEVLLARANFEYNASLMIDTQALQGTCIGEMGWETRTRTVKRPKRQGDPKKVDMPVGGTKTVQTAESIVYTLEPVEITQTTPYFINRQLGSVMFDPKWSTPNRPDLCAYSVAIDYVTWYDLEEMRQLEGYTIPNDAALRNYFIENPMSSASAASQTAIDMSSSGAPALHAEGDNFATSIDPFSKPLKLIRRFDQYRRIAVLCIEGVERYFTIQNELQDDTENPIPHVTANWRNVQRSGYGVGLGRLVGCEQRVKQGVINHSLRSLSYRFNAPLLTAQGTNAPTQNVLARLGGFFEVQPLGNNVKNSVGFLDLPPIPAEAFSMLQWASQSEQGTSGADAAMAEGNISQRGSSAARTATGAQRVAQKSDQRASNPINNFAEGVVVRFVKFLIDGVKMQKLTVVEIRDILKEKLADKITDTFSFDDFFESEFDVRVLAGAKLAAKSSIAQILPFLLQIFQQPQILDYLHEEGETVDYAVIANMLIQYSELQGEYDIFRDMTDQEKQQYEKSKQMSNPKAMEVQGKIQQEQIKGKNKLDEVQARGQIELARDAVKTGIDKLSEGQPLQRAEAFDTRADDEQELRQGAPGI